MNNLQIVLNETRRRGNTTWILKSAIKNPNCIIIAGTMQQASYLREEYFKLIKNAPFFKKIWWNYFGRKHPEFTSINNIVDSLWRSTLPIIFDNSALFL